MAKILDKDPSTYAKEREGFLRDLQHFHDTRGTPFRRCPTLGGKEIDLFLLYSLVTAQGGWVKVNAKNTWTDLLTSFQITRQCVNGGVALKQIYLRYLDRWEKVHYLGEEADRGSDDDEESRHKRWSARALHSVPHTYNYTQHSVAESSREYNHLSTDLYRASDYDRLALSLISPLPNEQDFAINVCTLLSNDGKHTLKLEKHPRIVDFLLAHAGVFSHSSLRQLFVHFYKDIRKRPLHTFWRDVLESTEFLDLTNETKFCKTGDVVKGPLTSDSLVKDDKICLPSEHMEVDSERFKAPETVEVCDSDSDCEIVGDTTAIRLKLRLEPADSELFCLRRTLGTQDYVGQRVLQVGTILRNLCYIEENVPILVKNLTFFRFLLLCANSQWNALKNLGLDMLGNISTELVVKDVPNEKLGYILIKVISRNLLSEDRSSCISSLEVLNKLSQNEANEDILLRSLEVSVYKKVCSFLTIHDVMLLIYTLECLYSLSSLGERSCNFIANNHGVIDTLVSLVTVEGKSYGPRACIGMKLVETIPSGIQVQQKDTLPINHPQQQQITSSVGSSIGVTVSSVSSVVSSLSQITSVPKVLTSMAARVATPSTPVRTVPIAPQRLLPATPTTAATTVTATTTPLTVPQGPTPIGQPMTAQQLIQQQHAHQQAIHENEQFALAWLRATCEPAASSKIDHQELYRHYLTSCSKIGRRGVISPLHFPRCVRSVFGGTVGPNPVKPANPNDPQYYEGIKVRAQPLLLNVPVSTSTPSTPVTSKTQRRKSQNTKTLTVNAECAEGGVDQISPASPILKAQLSAPPKQRESAGATSHLTNKGDTKSQMTAHPHLSQALLSTTTSVPLSTTAGTSKDQLSSQGSSTSLIKSLLATKVNECMTAVSMKTATDCQNVAQVAARQQRLLAQQSTENQQKTQIKIETLKAARLNGVRQLFPETDVNDSSISSSTQLNSTSKGKKEPPQPPPPPLAPLSNNVKPKTPPVVNEDSNSAGNNSLSSLGIVGIGGVSSTEDGDNSLTSFEGLLNGIPNVETTINEDSNSKDSIKATSTEILINKPLRLADLLEKKIEKSPPLLNGTLGRDIKGDKLDLVENHIEKALSRDNNIVENKIDETKNDTNETTDVKNEEPLTESEGVLEKHGLKRSASDDIVDSETKKPHLANVNGSSANSPAPDSVTSSNGDEGPSTVSTAAAKLFADIAADILEDEDEEQLLQDVQSTSQTVPSADTSVQQSPLQQIIVDNNQQMLLSPPRQIIVSQGQIQPSNQSIVISSGGQLKTQSGQTVIVQNPNNQQRTPMLIQQSNAGQLLLSQGLQGQVQLVASSQPGQYVLQTSGTQGAYMVAQSQSTVVGQQQTVLLAQTPQQQGTGAKTIIILQQQPTNSATHHSKVVMTPQGQQVVVTQVPRPVVHSSTVSNNSQATKAIKPAGSNGTASTNGISEKGNPDDTKPKVSIVRDLTTAFVCEWGDCNIETKFKSANEVYLHVCESHCPTGSEEIMCQWERCDNMKRKRFSLMTHLHDKHCNTDAMRQSLVRRKQISQGAKVEHPPQPTTSPHPGYAPDAALHAIKRHALEFVNPKELQDDNEGPVTKSIRLTASLILRNLVIYSSNGKRYLKSYESHLANIALSNVESSRTIAQILYDMNEGITHR